MKKYIIICGHILYTESELKVVSTNSTTLIISYHDVNTIPLEKYECEVYDGNLTTTTINVTADQEETVGSLQPNTSYLIWCTGYNGSTEGCLDITTKSQGTFSKNEVRMYVHMCVLSCGSFDKK